MLSSDYAGAADFSYYGHSLTRNQTGKQRMAVRRKVFFGYAVIRSSYRTKTAWYIHESVCNRRFFIFEKGE